MKKFGWIGLLVVGLSLWCTEGVWADGVGRDSEVARYLKQTLRVDDPGRVLLSEVVRGELTQGFDGLNKKPLDENGNLSEAGRDAVLKEFSPVSSDILMNLIEALALPSYNNSMIVGPSGAGKSFVMKQLAYILTFGVMPDFLREALSVEASLSMQQLMDAFFNKTQIVTVDYDLLSLDNTRSGQAYAKADVRMRSILIDLFEAAKKDFKSTGTRTIFLYEEVATLPPLVQQTLKKRLDNTGFKAPSENIFERGSEVGYSAIGITTPGEYRDMAEADSAIDRRYKRIIFHEPTEQQVLEILQRKKEGWSNRYQLHINDEVLAYVISMRKFFSTPPLAMPDSVIKVLNGLMQWCSNPKNQKLGQEVTIEEAYEYLIQQSHLPNEIWLGGPNQDHAPLWNLGDRLKEVVVDHEDLIDRIAMRIKTGRLTGFRQTPVFILMGSSGSGKDTLIKAINQVMFGHDGSHLKFDLSGSRGADLKAILEVHGDNELPLLAKAFEEGPTNGAILLNEAKDMPSSQFNLLKVMVEDGVIRPRGNDRRERPLGLNMLFIVGQFGEELFEGKSDEEIQKIAENLTERDLIEVLQRGADNGRTGAIPYALIQRAIRTGGLFIMPPVRKQKYPEIVARNLKHILANLKTRTGLEITVDQSVLSLVSDLAIQNHQGPRGLDGTLSDLVETSTSEAIDQGLPQRNAKLNLSLSPDKSKVLVQHREGDKTIQTVEIAVRHILRTRCEQILKK